MTRKKERNCRQEIEKPYSSKVERKKCCVFMDIAFAGQDEKRSKTHDPEPGTKMPSWRDTADGQVGKVQADSGLPRLRGEEEGSRDEAWARLAERDRGRGFCWRNEVK